MRVCVFVFSQPTPPPLPILPSLQVPTLFNKIYSGIHASIKSSSPLKQKAFAWAMQAGRARRSWLNDHPSSPNLPWLLNAQYALAHKVVFSKVLQKFGGKLRFCMSGGAPLSSDIQDFFADMGIPILEGCVVFWRQN